MKILLDTHILLWCLADSAKLPSDVVDMLKSNENEIYFSVVSLWEVAIKRAIRTDFIPFDEKVLFSLAIKSGFYKLNLNEAHIFELSKLKRETGSLEHKDPFDKMLICQAKYEGFNFITHDKTLKYYNEDFIKVV